MCIRDSRTAVVGADRDARRVDVAHAHAATVEELSALHRPEHVGNSTPRVRAVEDRAFTVEAELTLYRGESDGDTHLVLRGASGRTIIAEIPSAECMPADSPFRAAVEGARSAFASRFHRRSARGLHVRVRVTGPAFFDFLHRQTGVAGNGIEIHPVTRIEFLQ